jgi:bacteriocin-like protein
MAKSDKPTTNKSKPGISSPDKLLKTGKDSKIELTDDELSKVTGGKHIANIKYG